MTLEMGAWIAAIAVLPLTMIGWFFAGRKEKINKSHSRDGIAVSGVHTGNYSPVNVNLTTVENNNAHLAKLAAKADREERKEQSKDRLARWVIIYIFVFALIKIVEMKTEPGVPATATPAIANSAERDTSANSAGPKPLPVPHGPWRALNPGEWTPTKEELAKLPK
jgi:hypothetical protein